MSGPGAAGICWDGENRTWRAAIHTDGGEGESKLRHLGTFLNELNAALAYDQVAREHHGDEAELNFPEGPPALPPAALSEAPRQASSQYRGEGIFLGSSPQAPDVCGLVNSGDECWMIRWGPQMSVTGARAAGVCWHAQAEQEVDSHDQSRHWRWQEQAEVPGELSERAGGGAGLRPSGARAPRSQGQAQLPGPTPSASSASSKTSRKATSRYRGKSQCTRGLGSLPCSTQLAVCTQIWMIVIVCGLVIDYAVKA
jgi:hypothetical protein